MTLRRVVKDPKSQEETEDGAMTDGELNEDKECKNVRGSNISVS